jgi:hypothetical protein
MQSRNCIRSVTAGRCADLLFEIFDPLLALLLLVNLAEGESASIQASRKSIDNIMHPSNKEVRA